MSDGISAPRGVTIDRATPVAPAGSAPASRPASAPAATFEVGARPLTAEPAKLALPERNSGQPDRVLARVGSVDITTAQVDTERRSIESEQELASVADAFAADLGLTRGANEDVETFIARVRNELDPQKRAALEKEIASTARNATDQALLRLVNHASLVNLVGGDAAGGPVAEANARLRERLGAQLIASKQSSPDEARGRVETMLAAEARKAIIEPSKDVILSAIASAPEATRDAVATTLLGIDLDRDGLAAGASLATDLQNHGPGATYLDLVRATGSTSWTVGDVTKAAQNNPRLKPTVDDLVRGLDASTPLVLTASTQGLSAAEDTSAADRAAYDAISSRVRDGKAKVAWSYDAPAPALVVADKNDGNPKASAQFATDMAEAVNTEARQLGARMRGAAPVTVPGAPLSDDAMLQLARESPLGTASMKLSVFDSVVAGQSTDELKKQAASVHATDEQTHELLDLQRSLRLLMSAEPLPKALRPGGGGVALPLVPGARLNDDQRAAVKALQTYAIHAGKLAASAVELGTIDAATAALLGNMATDGGPVLSLKPEQARVLVTNLAVTGRFASAPVADLILSHPAVIADRQAGEHNDAVQLVTAYLREQGLLKPEERPGTTAFLAALDRSRAMPLDPALLKRARADAAAAPVLSGPALETLLSATAMHTAGGVYSLEPADAASKAALRAHLAALGSESERTIDRSKLGQLAAAEPIVALRMARAQFIGATASVDGAGSIDSALTAGELSDLRRIAFGEGGPHKAAWLRVIDGVRQNKITIATLDRPPTDGPLHDDAATVYADLRGMARAIAATTAPTAHIDKRDSTLKQTADDAWHAFTHPIEFSNPLVPNNVRDWQLLAIRGEMQRAGVGAPPVNANDVQREKLMRVDANFIDFMLKTHADAIGRSDVETLLQTFPSHLPRSTTAKGILEETAKAMREGREPVWSTLNVALGDVDERTIAAKLVMQAALRTANGPSAATEGMTSLVGVHADDIVPDTNALLVQRGAVSVASLADSLQNRTFDKTRLLALADIGRRNLIDVRVNAPDLVKPLEDAVRTIQRLADMDQLVTLTGPLSELGAAASTIVRESRRSTMPPPGVGMVDFAKQLGEHEALTIRGATSNQLDTTSSVATLFDRARMPASADEAKALWRSSWDSRLSGDWSRTAETAAASHVLLKHMMHTMLQYDLLVAPPLSASRALYTWATNDDPTVRAAALAQAGQSVGQATHAIAQIAGSMFPLAYPMDIKRDIDAGNVDLAIGKLPSYTAMTVGTTLTDAAIAYGVYRGGARVVQALRERRRNAESAPLKVVGVALNADVTAEVLNGGTSLTTPRRAFGYGYAGLRATTDAVLSPGRPIAATLGALGDVTTGRSRRVVSVPAGDVPKLPSFVTDWIASSRNGETALLIHGETAPVTVRNSDLATIRAAHGIPDSMMRRFQATGVDMTRVGPLLTGVAEQLSDAPVASTSGTTPTIRTLSQEADDTSRRWTVSRNNVDTQLDLTNAQTRELIRTSSNATAFQRALRTYGLEDKAPAVRAVVGTFDSGSAFANRFWLRAAGAANLPGRISDATRRIASRGRRDDDVAGAAPSSQAPVQIDQRMSAVRQELASWVQREAGGALTGAALAEHNAWLEKTRTELSGMNPDGVAANTRVSLASLRADLAARSLLLDLRTKGYVDAAVRIAKGTGRSLSGAVRSPNFYLLLAAGGQQLAVDLGKTLNDQSLTRIEKQRDSAWAVGKFVAGGFVGSALMRGLNRVSPSAAAGMARGMGLSIALNIENIAELTYDATHERYGGLEAIKHWQDYGIPDAGFMHVNEPGSWLSWIGAYDTSNDVGVLERNQGDAFTARTDYWYADANSPLHQRLRQLIATEPGDVTPVRYAQRIVPANVHAYAEPVYDSVHFLDKLPDLQKHTARLAEVEGVRGFSSEAFDSDIKRVAASVIYKAKVDDSEEIYDIDDEALLRALKTYDRYGDLSPEQRALLDKRDAMTVRQAKRWAGTVGAMSISDDAKQAALTQMIKNYAATYLANSIMYRYDPAWRGRSSGPTAIDDFYLAANTLTRR